MTQTEMMSLLRRFTDDRNTTTWTDTELRVELNESMRFVARQVVKHQGLYNYANGSVTITTDGTNKTFATSQPSFYKFWRVVRTDTPTEEPCSVIDVRDAADYAAGSGFDVNNQMIVYFTISTSGDVVMGFPVTPSANLTFRAEFSVRPSKLTTATSADGSNTFTLLAEDWHELVVVDAAVRMTTGDKSIQGPIMDRWKVLMADMASALGQRKAVSVSQVRPWNRMYGG